MATPNGTSQLQDVSRGMIINAINWLGVSLSIIFVAARVYTRTALMRAFGWDDALLILATVDISLLLDGFLSSYQVSNKVD
jgi:hypothetical protein